MYPPIFMQTRSWKYLCVWAPSSKCACLLKLWLPLMAWLNNTIRVKFRVVYFFLHHIVPTVWLVQKPTSSPESSTDCTLQILEKSRKRIHAEEKKKKGNTHILWHTFVLNALPLCHRKNFFVAVVKLVARSVSKSLAKSTCSTGTVTPLPPVRISPLQ